jgi:hypothetical protein
MLIKAARFLWTFARWAPLAMSKRCQDSRTKTVSGQKRFQPIGQSWHVKRHVVKPWNKLSAGIVPGFRRRIRAESPNCSLERTESPVRTAAFDVIPAGRAGGRRPADGHCWRRGPPIGGEAPCPRISRVFSRASRESQRLDCLAVVTVMCACQAIARGPRRHVGAGGRGLAGLHRDRGQHWVALPLASSRWLDM